MTEEAEPGQPPAHDLAAFDLAKRSPEQLAQSFAQWKARRRPTQAAASAAAPAPKPPPAAADKAEKTTEPKRGWAKRSIPVQYSDTFSTLLAAGSEPAVQRIELAPILVARPSPRRAVSPGRRLKAMTILAGAASLVTLAGGALLEVSRWRDTEPKSAPMQTAAAPATAPIARAATNVRTVAWTLKPMVDRALLKAAAPPAVQTASKAATPSAKPAPVQAAFKQVAPETTQFVAKPFIPNAAPAPQPVPAAARASFQTAPLATAVHTGDPRPDALFQQGRGQGDGAFGGRLASSGKPAATPKSNDAVQAPATARNGKATSAGGGDPRGEGSGGAQAASDAGSETDPDATGGNDAAAGEGGSAPGDGNAGGADAGGSSGGDAGGADGADGASDGGDGAGGSSDAGPAGDTPGNAAGGDSGTESDDAGPSD